ncbi:hypothetical protein FRC11_001112 [Ceratobasidium sp. 423]|nr:hypothetical protein FRC11_001112 [Ceratobasidium sp. 423]
MFQVDTTRKLKRQASSDIEEGPVKQARISVKNARLRHPPLRRSDSQALDINATAAIVEHLPDAHELVPVPSELQHRSKKEQDESGSTDEESQDEEAAWERRAKAHRHNMLFKRPREPAPKVKRPLLIKTASEIALVESDSEDEQPLGPVRHYGTSEAAARREQRLMAFRATCAAAPKRLQVSTAAVPNSISVPSAKNIATTRLTRTTSGTTLTTTTASAVDPAHFQKTSLVADPERPKNQDSRTRQSAIDAIAGHRTTVVPSVPAASAPLLSATSSLSPIPSQTLRRSRRVVARK